ncbi:MAG: DUF4249 domain-containing protein [Bacteroidota bacterium]
MQFVIRHLLLFIAFGSVLILAGCAREVIIKIPEEAPKLVAICHFTAGEPFKVKLSTSEPVYGSGSSVVPEVADVSISKNGAFLDKLFRTFTQQGELYWQSRDTAVAGQKYSMAIKVEGYPNIDATGYMPQSVALEPIRIQAADIDTITLNDGRFELRVPLSLQVKNLPKENRFFAFRLSHEIGAYDFTQEPPELLYTITSDSTFFLADGRTLSLLHNIPEPAVLINENFWNEDRTTLNLIARIPFNPEERVQKIFVEWRTLSSDFYRYHLSLARQGSSVPLSEPDAVYNNINGGYGNFSGYSTVTYTVSFPK